MKNIIVATVMALSFTNTTSGMAIETIQEKVMQLRNNLGQYITHFRNTLIEDFPPRTHLERTDLIKQANRIEKNYTVLIETMRKNRTIYGRSLPTTQNEKKEFKKIIKHLLSLSRGQQE